MEDPWRVPDDLPEPPGDFELEEPPSFGEPSQLESEVGLGAPGAFAGGVLPRENRPRVVVFSLGDADLAVDVGQVVEIESLREVAELPNVPAWVLGVTQLRGEIVSVIDLRRFAGLPAGAGSREARVLVVRAAGGDAVSAFAVDRVVGIRELGPPTPPDRLPPVAEPLAAFAPEAGWIDDRHLRLADLGRLLTDPVLRERSPGGRDKELRSE